MPRPKSKDELLSLSASNYKKLLTFIDGLSPAEQNKEFKADTLNRNIRDVLAHIHHWHLLQLGWYEVGMNGKKPDMPAKGYTWKTMPDLNRWILNNYQTTTLDQAKDLLNESRARVQAIIKSHSDEELFTKKNYSWTGSTSLAAYLISNTSSHYAWGLKLIKKGQN